MTPRRLEEIDAALAAGVPSTAFLGELQAAALDPATLRRLAQVLLLERQWPRAVAVAQLASALRPGDADYKAGLGTVLLGGAAYQAAHRCYEEALALKPDDLSIRFSRAQGHHFLYQIDEAIQDYDVVLERQPDNVQTHSFRMVALNYRETNQEPFMLAARAYGKLLGPAVNHETGARRQEAGTRVGILSADLRSHSVTYFLRPLLERIPQGIEVRLYGDSNHEDEVTQELAKLTGHYQNVHVLNNDALEKLFLAEKLDVAIDLSGHFSKNRLPVFGRRVAPVQVSYLGYPNTTGVRAMDWRIGDSAMDAGSGDRWTERLTTLRAGMLAYAPPQEAPPVSKGMPSQSTLGYFGHLGKISPECARTWGEILKEVPSVKLLIKGDGLGSPEVRARWQRRWAAWGLDTCTNQVILREHCGSRASHLAMYGEITLSLDTWPYNGTTTICESLWMGVPVLTMKGVRHASRVGAGLIQGLGSWVSGLGGIVTTPEGYKIAAVQAMVSPVRLARGDLAKAKWLQHDAVAEEFWSTIRQLQA